MSTKKVVVSVETTTETSATVSIDGVEYALVDAQDLELRDALWLAKAGRDIQEAGEDLSDEHIERLSRVLDRMVRVVLPTLKDEVFAKLKSKHKLAIAGAFTEAAGEGGAEPRPSGIPSSPGSSDSTAAPEPTGSTAQ